MKYYYEEITVLIDGTSAQALFEKPSEIEARSAAAIAYGSALANPNMVSVSTEAKNSTGFVYEKHAFTIEGGPEA